ncbi:cysteine--tRNA ligase [Candidatus Woesebacteria bacterium]|nr:cysteine--tRNA ligase [Candidatus Woesebacteria bacterium]
MFNIFLTNSLTRKKEKFVPINPPNVGMYTCGPTVYNYLTIGNFRTYTLGDILLRTLKSAGFKVKYIMNLTDVGHLTGDNLGDADIGEDRLEKAARREGKTAWDVADFYTKAFFRDYEKLNLIKPELFAKATDHIPEQIELVKKLEEKGLTYKIDDGIYFDTRKFEKSTGKKYGELSTLDVIKEGARVEPNKQKRNPRDFALWKFSYKGGRSFDSAQDAPSSRRDMEWESPWGIGFPGWHIECSAMSMKYLGESFDIHVGGEDLRSTHHPNEIAQAEGATGKQFVKYWIHGAFLTVDGGRMGKSLGNAYTITDIEKKGIDPIALRYFYLTGHYRSSLNFTWDALKSSATALENLREQVRVLKSNKSRTVLSPEKNKKVNSFSKDFTSAIYDDLNTPQALAVVWNAVKSNIPSEDKYDLLMTFDEVFGLDLSAVSSIKVLISSKVASLIKEREDLRKKGDFEAADKKRIEIESEGFLLEDLPQGVRVKKK